MNNEDVFSDIGQKVVGPQFYFMEIKSYPKSKQNPEIIPACQPN